MRRERERVSNFPITGASKVNDMSSMSGLYERIGRPPRSRTILMVSNRQFYEAASPLIRRLHPTDGARLCVY